MHRRTLLGTLGGVLLTGIAGCMSASDGDSPTPTDDSNPGTTQDAAIPTADGDTDGSRPADGVTPAAMSVDLSEIPCPTVGEDVDLRVCSTTTDLDDAAVALVPPRPPLFEPTTGDGGVDVFEIELHNQSAATFGFNPYDWALKRHTDDGWNHIAPEMTPEPWTRLDPDETYTYGLSVESVPTERVDGSRRIVQDLDSGTYALVVNGLLERGEGSERVECAAVFVVERSAN